MKSVLVFVCILLLFSALQSQAESSSDSYKSDFLTELLTNLFDLSKPFSGVVEITASDSTLVRTTAGIACQDGNMRAYVDMTNVQDTLLPAAYAKRIAAIRKSQGLSRYIVLMRKGDPARYTLFPDRKAYHTNGFISMLSATISNKVTFERSDIGQETIDGQLCRKIALHVSDGTDAGATITCWRTMDANDFPLKIQVGSDMTFAFKQMRFNRLDPSLFEVPPDYKLMTSIEAIAGEAEAAVRPDGTMRPATPPPVGQPADPKADLAARLLKWNQDLADKGDGYGQLRMGIRYRDGDGVPQDFEKARDYLQKASDQGVNDAAIALAKLPPPPAPVSVTPKQSEIDISDFAVHSASFGWGNNNADVTTRVTELLDARSGGFIADFKSLRADPLPGKIKNLTVRYDYKGKPYTLIVREGNKLSYRILAKNARSKEE